MNLNFDVPEVYFMYKHFKDQIRLLEFQKNSPNRPLEFDQQLKLFKSIISKFESSYPDLMDNFSKIEEKIHP